MRPIHRSQESGNPHAGAGLGDIRNKIQEALEQGYLPVTTGWEELRQQGTRHEDVQQRQEVSQYM